MTAAIATRQQVTPPGPAAVYADAIPPWLNYLVAAYPTAKLAAHTFAVLEDAFSDVAPAVMRQAARAAVDGLRFFPSVYELRGYVQKEQERTEGEEFQLPPVIYYRRMSQIWPICPNCGERLNPEWDDCPACLDMARIGVQP